MGWQKKVLRVDLTKGTSEIEPLNMDWANAYLGERGLATKYLWENMDPAADAMGPDNVLIFATGPLTGTMASTSGRYAVVTKGPLTGAIACSNSGGKFGAELKFAGYDLLIVQGVSPEPVYLHIVDETVEIACAARICSIARRRVDTVAAQVLRRGGLPPEAGWPWGGLFLR